MGLSATAREAAATDITVSTALSLEVQQWNRRPASGEDGPAQNLSIEDKAEAEKRFEVIEALVFPGRFPEIWEECGGKTVPVEYALAAKHGCGARTIRDWAAKYKLHGMRGLVTRDRSDKGMRRKSNKALDEFLIGHVIPQPGVFGALTVNEIYRAYLEERDWRSERVGQVLKGPDAEKYASYLDEDGRLSERWRLPKVTCKTLRAYVNAIPEPVRTLARDGLEKYQNTQEILSHRALSEIDPLEYLVGDHRLVDAFCRIPVRGGWLLARPWCTVFIDMRTRRFLGWGLFQVPSSDSIASVLKRVCIEWGVPRCIYIDNGRDYRSEFLEGKHIRRERTGPVGEFDPTWRGVFGALGVRVIHSIVRRARSKIVEPNFRRIAGFDMQIPEYCGHRPSERPEAFSLMVKQHEAWLRGERQESPFRTIQEMAAFYDAAITRVNEMPLEGEGMLTPTPTGHGWMSPAQCWEKLIQKVERRTVRTEDLHVVFTKRRQITVKHGELFVTFGGKGFHYRLDGEPTQLMALNGKLVEIAFDPHNLEQVAIYFRDRFVGIATCIALRKMGEDLFVADERERRGMRRDIKRAIATIHKRVPVASPEERLARRREILPQRAACGAGTPIALPAPLAEAAAAFRAQSEARSAEVEIIHVERIERPADKDDGRFNFFSDGGTA